MNQQETEQFAALRMHVAHLHNGLKEALDNIDREAWEPSLVARLDAALAESEPSIRDILAEADRDAKLNACREQLAETTARLALVEGQLRGHMIP